jgi:hypothetical protein
MHDNQLELRLCKTKLANCPCRRVHNEAILRLARALARQAAREDHEKEQASRRNEEREPRSMLDSRKILQNERSIEDHISRCRSYAEREGLAIICTYEDWAVQGARLWDAMA